MQGGKEGGNPQVAGKKPPTKRRCEDHCFLYSEFPNGNCEKDDSLKINSFIPSRSSTKETIVDERKTKQDWGRPYKQFLLRWKSPWVDGGRLTAPWFWKGRGE